MKHLDLTVFEPGDEVASISTDGRVTIFKVQADGSLISGNPQLLVGFKLSDPIESLQFTVRTYNLLKREGIHTVEAFLMFDDAHSIEQMQDIRNLADKNAAEIRTKANELRGHGVTSQ